MSSYKACTKRAWFSSVSLCALAFGSLTSFAQTADSDSNEGEELRQDAVIVTGVAEETSKKDATFTVNTFSDEEIQELASILTADILQNVPGIFAEGSTAGEASNNITVRGLPVTGGFRYAPQLIDGLPWFEEPEVQFMNNDTAARADIMTKTVEVVKGGTGGILYSNGLGATINHVTRTGGDEFEGGYKLEVADYGFLRNDLYVSGPINDNLTFAVGGFYRVSDGLRDVGFTADNGGQIRANLLYTSDDESLTVFGQYHKIDDKTAFYQNVPFQVPSFTERGTADNPTVVEPDQIYELGIDFQDGSVVSPLTRTFPMLGEYGSREIDMADGLHANFDMFTFKLGKELESGWKFDAGLRVTSGTNDFNAMFTGNDTAFADRFNNVRFNNDLLNRARGAFDRGNCDDAYLAGFYADPADCATNGFGGMTWDQFVADASNAGSAAGVGAFYLDGGDRVADDALLNFLVPFITNSEADSMSFDARLSKSFDLYGTHDVTLGYYRSDYSVNQSFQAGLLVATMSDEPRLADLRGIDSNGNIVGPSLTLDSAILPGFFGYVSDIQAKGNAFYVLDHWETMDGKLKIDAGLRYQDQDASVVRRDRGVQGAASNLTPASVVPGSSDDTTADNEVQLPGDPRYLNDSFDGFGWSLGANYSVQPNMAVYGLISSSFRLPSLEDLNEFRVDSARQEEQVEDIMQYEGGLRYYADNWDTQVAVFYNEFSPRQESVTFCDFTSAQCTVNNGVPDINSCPEAREFFQRGVQNVGVEVEGTWNPSYVEGLGLKGNLVLQKPEITDANFRTVRTLVDANGITTGYEFEQQGEDGRRPRRLSETMLNVSATWDLKPYTDYPVKPYVRYSYFGDRFSESRDTDVTLYPEYFHLGGGFIYDFSENLAFQFHVSNITNELSLTEGDPIFVDLKGPNGATNRGVGRPLFGRRVRAMLSYRF